MTADAYAEWKSGLAQARLAVGPSELHGSITGLLCAGWAGPARELLGTLALDIDAADGPAGLALSGLVERAASRIAHRLRAGEAVELLLPEASVAVRADALVDWCRGYLGGLGLTGVLGEAGSAPAIRERLENLARIAAQHIDPDDHDAAALRDVVVYVRAAVARFYEALAPTARP